MIEGVGCSVEHPNDKHVAFLVGCFARYTDKRPEWAMVVRAIEPPSSPDVDAFWKADMQAHETVSLWEHIFWAARKAELERKKP